MQIRNKRDFWSGMMFLIIGLLFVILSRQYQLGTAAKMGPGYFPTVLGGLAGRARHVDQRGRAQKEQSKNRTGGGRLERIGAGAAGCRWCSRVLLPKLGMVISLIALIFISARASHEFGWRDTALADGFSADSLVRRVRLGA